MHPNTLRALLKHLGTLQFEPPKSKLTTVQTFIVFWWLEIFGKQSVVGCWVVWTYIVQRWLNANLRRCLGKAPLIRFSNINIEWPKTPATLMFTSQVRQKSFNAISIWLQATTTFCLDQAFSFAGYTSEGRGVWLIEASSSSKQRHLKEAG